MTVLTVEERAMLREAYGCAPIGEPLDDWIFSAQDHVPLSLQTTPETARQMERWHQELGLTG